MSKHTRGPWTMHDERAGAFIVTAGDRETGYPICARPSSIGEKESECLANARLIAAAPDLLEALESGRSLLHALATPDDRVTQVAMRQIDNAIAEAKGEKP